MEFMLEDLLRVVLAAVAGAIIGTEREFRDKAAGFRTLIFICVGAALFSIFSYKLDESRIAANIATGVGFIGAGVIMREVGRITGLTTAATIWLTAALGMGIGYGYYLFALVVAGITAVMLWTFPRLEDRIRRVREERVYEVVCALSAEKLAQLLRLLRESGLFVKSQKHHKVGEDMVCIWDTYGLPRAHDCLTQTLFADPEVKTLRF